MIIHSYNMITNTSLQYQAAKRTDFVQLKESQVIDTKSIHPGEKHFMLNLK